MRRGPRPIRVRESVLRRRRTMVAHGVRWWRYRMTLATFCLLLSVATSGAQNTYPSNGNVGIGTTSPSVPLQVFGNNTNVPAILGSAGHTRLIVTTPSTAYNPKVQLDRGGSNAWEIGVDDGYGAGGLYVYGGGGYRFGITSGGNVGIGTWNPGAPLHVYSTATNVPAIFGSVSHTRVRVTTPSTSYSPKLQLDRGGSNAWEIGVDDGYGAGGLYVYGGNAYRFGITASGNVGIGTNNPSAQLHVAGNVQVDGNIAAKFQDVAEWVRTAGHLPSATVVIIDPKEPHRVAISDKAYDTRVAGVVSLQPGLLLGEAGEDKAKVAHSGRVKLKVDAQYGAVAVGDLLVTSPTPGHAMRSEPVTVSGVALHRPGTLVGKALESLDTGQGEILVLLTLQ